MGGVLDTTLESNKLKTLKTWNTKFLKPKGVTAVDFIIFRLKWSD